MSTESTVHYCRLSAVTIITLYNFTEEFRVIFCFLAHIYIWVNSLSRLGSSRSLGDSWWRIRALFWYAIACYFSSRFIECLHIERCTRWRISLRVCLTFDVCNFFRLCWRMLRTLYLCNATLTFSIESNGPTYSDKPEFCQRCRGCCSG